MAQYLSIKEASKSKPTYSLWFYILIPRNTMLVGLWLLMQLVTWITYGHTIPVERGKINLMSPYMSVKSVWWSQVFEITQKMYQEETYYRTGCFGELRCHMCGMDAASAPSVPILLKQWMKMTDLQFSSSFQSINRTLLKPVSQNPFEQHSRMKQCPGPLVLHFYALLQDYKYSS